MLEPLHVFQFWQQYLHQNAIYECCLCFTLTAEVGANYNTRACSSPRQIQRNVLLSLNYAYFNPYRKLFQTNFENFVRFFHVL
jgi:hypothetical protein